MIWDELQRQLDAKGLGEGKETAQDASLIKADQVRAAASLAEAPRRRGEVVMERG